MQPLPTIVKLGGSILTRKRGPPRIRPKLLARLAEELAVGGRPPVVVLHGAGSFGHPGAVRWGLAEPPAPRAKPPARLRGAAVVSAEVRKLHAAVLRALLDVGLAPLSVPSQPLARSRGGNLVELDLAPFRRALAAGGIPVGFGDVVPDDEWGFSILSADTIAVELARRLPSRRVLFVSDVNGVYANRPNRGRPRVIERVTRATLAELRPRAEGPDVTGGIRGKVSAMVAAAEAGAEVGLISGLRHGALSRALRGEAVYGSWSGPQLL